MKLINYITIKLIAIYSFLSVSLIKYYKWLIYNKFNINNIFNNRELALGIWLVVVLIFMISNKGIRTSLFNIIKITFNKKFIIVYICMMMYTILIVYMLYRIGFWKLFLLKDTILWFLFTGIVSAFRAIDKAKDVNYFKITIKDNIKIILLFEFIVNSYTFSFWGELILIPVSFFIVMLLICLYKIPEFQNEKSKPIKKFFGFINIILGLGIVLNSILLAIRDIKNLETIDTLKSFLLPSILSVLFLVFIYFFVLWAAYEHIFIRIKFGEKKSKRLIAYTKFKIIVLCNFNFNRVKSFWQISGLRILKIKNKADVIEVINDYRVSE